MSDENLSASDEPSCDDEYENSESLELVSGRVFGDWDEFKNWIYRFAKKEGLIIKLDQAKRTKV